MPNATRAKKGEWECAMVINPIDQTHTHTSRGNNSTYQHELPLQRSVHFANVQKTMAGASSSTHDLMTLESGGGNI